MKPSKSARQNRKLSITGFVLSFFAFIMTIWIVVPAPSYYVWLFSVLASEWSLCFSIFAILGVFCALLTCFKNGGRLWILSLILGVAAFVISFYPFLSAYRAANLQNTTLSWQEFLSGFGRQDSNFNFSTRRFAEVGGNELKMDIYSPPEGVEKKGAGIIVIHGGSWNGGVRNDFPQWNHWLSENGYTIFDIDYRLAQPNWQTATGDVKCAAGWVARNASEFGISPGKIILMGRSAGAHLALLSAYSIGNSSLPASCEAENPNKIRAVIALYAPTDLIWDFDNPANQRVIDGPETLRKFVGGSPYESPEMRDRFLTASPTAYVATDTPPTLLIHGGQDQLVLPQNMNLLAARLKEKNISHQEILISYAQHGFDFNFKGWGSQVIKPQILEFLRENTK